MTMEVGTIYFYFLLLVSIFAFLWYFIYFKTNTYLLLHQLMNFLFTIQYLNIFSMTIFYLTFNPLNPISVFFEMISITSQTVFDAIFIGFLISVGIVS